MSEWFPINVGLRKGVMSLWLFNLYVYGWCSVRGECYDDWERIGIGECKW